VALDGEESGGIGGKFPPSMLKKPWFQNKHWGALTNWIWPIFLSKHSINLLTPQTHFLFFKASLPVKGFWKQNWRVRTFKNLFTVKIIMKNWNYQTTFKNLFSINSAALQKAPPWARSLQGSSLATLLVLHLVHQLPRICYILNNMRSDNRSRMWKLLSPVKLIQIFLVWFLRENKIEQI